MNFKKRIAKNPKFDKCNVMPKKLKIICLEIVFSIKDVYAKKGELHCPECR